MKSRPCPICNKPRAADYAPFCSSRCRDIDLGRWFSEDYAVPGPPADPDDIVKED